MISDVVHASRDTAEAGRRPVSGAIIERASSASVFHEDVCARFTLRAVALLLPAMFAVPDPSPLSLLSMFSSVPVAERFTTFLVDSYNEQGRYHHTLRHVASMLEGLARHGQDLDGDDRDVIELAIWFHDCIYDPLAPHGKNERDSVVEWQRFAQEMVPSRPAVEASVTTLIECTIAHVLPRNPPDHLSPRVTHLFLDLDLSILSTPADTYGEYAQNIRKEYTHFNDKAYCAGHAKVLQSFLGRECIYFSDAYRGTEDAARENIRRELAILCG